MSQPAPQQIAHAVPYVEVHMVATYLTQAATALLLPQHKPELTYRTSYRTGQGSLG